MNRIIIRIKGGLGNQLFCYAAARRLALVNNAELVIDDRTGFARDYIYHRHYNLDHFNIPCRMASPTERLEPFERIRRGMLKWMSKNQQFTERCYLEQDGLDFDPRLLSLRVNGTLYLDGYWQSEDYFKDFEQTIRKELQIIPPVDDLNSQIVEKVRNCNSVALHFRWFEKPGSSPLQNLSFDYYARAISLMETKVQEPHYFVFSDNPEAVRVILKIIPEKRFTIVSHNIGDNMAYADLWLMSECQHFITANSTFSWWGAWLSNHNSKIIITPAFIGDGIKSYWNFSGLIPKMWIQV